MPSCRTTPAVPPRSFSVRMRPSWLTSCALLAALLWSRAGDAICIGPESTIKWTYPSQGYAVPPDAVFWAVAPADVVTVAVDGVLLSPLGTGAVERFQFAPEAPLSEGEHELVVRAEQSSFSEPFDGGAFVTSDERRFPFQVAAEAARDGDANISSVKVYPIAFRGVPPKRISPPPEDFDAQCTNAATPLGFWDCDDTGSPPHIARITYEYEGVPVAYLVQGKYLVPRGCASFWVRALPEEGPAQFRVAAVLPNGVAEEHVFAEPVDFPPVDRGPVQGPPSACSMGLERRPAQASVVAVTSVVMLAACARRRMRRSS
jgi:hypothetical protein